MKKQHKRRLSALAVTLAILTFTPAALSGCGKFIGVNSGAKATATDTDMTATGTDASEPAQEEADVIITAGSFTLQKLGTIRRISYASEGGLVYQEDGKYGVISLDGQKDTGSIYEDVEAQDAYFEIKLTQPNDENDLEGVNSTGLIDGEGHEIIPSKYAALEKISDRYWQAIEATEKTDSDDYMIQISSGAFVNLSAKAGDPKYKGVRYVYDLTTGQPVNGVSSAFNYSIYAYGEVIRYVSDADEYVYVNADGQPLPDNDFVYNNGCYEIIGDGETVFYSASGEELFRCASDGYLPFATTDDDLYFLACREVDGETKVVVMDITGQVLSFEFSDRYCKVIGDQYILADGVLYDFDGNRVFEDSYAYAYCKTCGYRDLGIMLKTDEGHYTVLDQNGKVVYTGDETEGYYFNQYDFTVSRKTEEGTDYLKWEDGDFTIKNGNSMNAGFIRTHGENNTYTLVDSASGVELLTGYVTYYVDGNKKDGLFIYAETAEHTFDIYSVR